MNQSKQMNRSHFEFVWVSYNTRNLLETSPFRMKKHEGKVFNRYVLYVDMQKLKLFLISALMEDLHPIHSWPLL